MRSKFRVVCAVLATFVGITAFAPSASAESPEFCRADAFCLWPVFVIPGEEGSVPTSLVTDVDWSGSATAFRTYNGTRRYASVEYLVPMPDGSIQTHEGCFAPFWGYFTRPLTVTKVTLLDERPSTSCT